MNASTVALISGVVCTLGALLAELVPWRALADLVLVLIIETCLRLLSPQQVVNVKHALTGDPYVKEAGSA